MVNSYGQATGYDQFAPGRDVAKPRQYTPLQSAITGAPPPAPPAPTNYPADPSMMQWRSKTPGPQPQIQATAAPSSYAAPPIDPAIQQMFQSYVQQNNLQANQNDPTALRQFAQYAQSQGKNVQADYTDSNGHTGGLLVDGHPYQAIDGNNHFTQLQPWAPGGNSAAAQGQISPMFSAILGQQQQAPASLLQQLLVQQGASIPPHGV